MAWLTCWLAQHVHYRFLLWLFRPGDQVSGHDLSGGGGEDAVPQCFPVIGSGPVRGQVQGVFALRPGDPGRDVDQVPAQSGTAGDRVGLAGEGAGGAEQVVGDRGEHGPGAVCWERP